MDNWVIHLTEEDFAYLESDSDDSDDEAFDAIILQHIETYYDKEPCRTSALRGHEWVTELLNGHPGRIFEELRMTKHAFTALCYHLVNKGYYKFDPQQKISVEESVAIFLKLVATNTHHRGCAERFQHSPGTISHHVGKVCDALQLLAAEIICPQNVGQPHPRIVNDRRFNPYFMKCCGAIDGTLISCCSPRNEHTAWRSRHGNLCQNVLAVCDFDMRFVFVNTGFEGSAHDARVLADTAINPLNRFPFPITGWFYLADSGYINTSGFLAPHKNTLYHIHDFVGTRATPRTPAELFNRCHSALRNTIERTFGVLKKRFEILEKLPNYSPKKQGEIVMACCALHNWIKKYDGMDSIFREYEEEMAIPRSGRQAEQPLIRFDTSPAAVHAMGIFRAQLTGQMWTDQNANGPLFG